MRYYKLQFSDEYSLNTSSFTIVDGDNITDEYSVSDARQLPTAMLDEANFFFEDSSAVKADFQMMYFDWRLMSSKMYNVISRSTDNFHYQEIQVQSEESSLPYVICQFKERVDLLNKQYSKFLDGYLIKAVLDEEKLPFPDVFCLNESIGQSFFISSRIKEELEKNEFLGYQLNEVEIK